MNQRRPLKILVISDQLSDLTISLNEQGHEAHWIDVGDWDVIIGEKCCRMVPELVPYIDTTIKEVQRGKYGKRIKKAASGKRVQSA